MQNTNLCGLNMDRKMSIRDLGMKDAMKVTTSFLAGSLPLATTVNIEVKNPNKIQAAMNRFDWIAMIDEREMLRGAVNNRVVVPAEGGVSKIPLTLSMDLNEPNVIRRIWRFWQDWETLKTKIPYVVQEAVIVIRDIFRKYPNKYEGLLADIC